MRKVWRFLRRKAVPTQGRFHQNLDMQFQHKAGSANICKCKQKGLLAGINTPLFMMQTQRSYGAWWFLLPVLLPAVTTQGSFRHVRHETVPAWSRSRILSEIWTRMQETSCPTMSTSTLMCTTLLRMPTTNKSFARCQKTLCLCEWEEYEVFCDDRQSLHKVGST